MAPLSGDEGTVLEEALPERLDSGEDAALADPELTLEHSVTVVVVTSPAVSDPSLALLEVSLGSLRNVPGIGKCRFLVVCDGWLEQDADAEWFQAHKGLIPAARVTAYQERLAALEAAIVADGSEKSRGGATCGWVRPHWEVLRLETWHGYGRALLAGLDQVQTPLALVLQHDYAFVRPLELAPLARAMLRSLARANEGVDEVAIPLNYIALLKKAQVNYRSAIRARQGLDIGKAVAFIDGPGDALVSLTRLPQLYDSPHLARTQWYRTMLREGRYRKRGEGVPRGQFPEDVVSEFTLARARERGVRAVVEEFGTYLYEGDGQGPTIAHVDGRRFLDVAQRLERGWPACHNRYTAKN